MFGYYVITAMLCVYAYCAGHWHAHRAWAKRIIEWNRQCRDMK